MDDNTKALDGLPGNQEQPGLDDMPGVRKPAAEQQVGSDIPVFDPAPHEAESGEAGAGPHQLQAGMRS